MTQYIYILQKSPWLKVEGNLECEDWNGETNQGSNIIVSSEMKKNMIQGSDTRGEKKGVIFKDNQKVEMTQYYWQ